MLNLKQVIGLARSMGQKLKELGEPITVNAICPGLVPTGLNLGNPLMDVTPKEFFTPQATIVRAVERIIEDDSLTAQILECSVEDIVARPVLPYLNAAAEFIGAGKFKELISHEATSEFSAKQGKELTAMEI